MTPDPENTHEREPQQPLEQPADGELRILEMTVVSGPLMTAPIEAQVGLRLPMMSDHGPLYPEIVAIVDTELPPEVPGGPPVPARRVTLAIDQSAFRDPETDAVMRPRPGTTSPGGD